MIFGGYTHIVRDNESHEIDKNDIGNVRHIDFQDGRHLCYRKQRMSIFQLRGEIKS